MQKKVERNQYHDEMHDMRQCLRKCLNHNIQLEQDVKDLSRKNIQMRADLRMIQTSGSNQLALR